jgi:hypothetical protein
LSELVLGALEKLAYELLITFGDDKLATANGLEGLIKVLLVMSQRFNLQGHKITTISRF